METFADVIAAFPSAEALAGEIGEKGGTVRAWAFRNSIPSENWNAVVRAAEKFGRADITLELLAQLAETAARQRKAKADPAQSEAEQNDAAPDGAAREKAA